MFSLSFKERKVENNPKQARRKIGSPIPTPRPSTSLSLLEILELAPAPLEDGIVAVDVAVAVAGLASDVI